MFKFSRCACAAAVSASPAVCSGPRLAAIGYVDVAGQDRVGLKDDFKVFPDLQCRVAMHWCGPSSSGMHDEVGHLQLGQAVRFFNQPFVHGNETCR